MTDNDTPKEGEKEVEVKALQEALIKQTEINEGFKKQLDGIAGQLRLQKKEETKEEPKKEEKTPVQGDDPTKALESKVEQMQKNMDERSFALDKKEILIANGITDEDKGMFEGVNDLDAVKRIAGKIKAMSEANPKKEEEKEIKKVDIGTLLPKGKEIKDLKGSDLFANFKERTQGK